MGGEDCNIKANRDNYELDTGLTQPYLCKFIIKSYIHDLIVGTKAYWQLPEQKYPFRDILYMKYVVD